MYIWLSEPWSNNQSAWEFLRKCYVGTMREMSTDKFLDVLQEASDILKNKACGNFLEKLMDMSPWSLKVLWELRSIKRLC